MSAATSSAKEPTAAQPDEWVVLPEACRLLRKHRAQVLALIVRGELTADTRGRYTFVSRESIERYLAGSAAA